MEIGLARKGEVQVLIVKGRLRLQHWRVVDKHLDSMLEKGCRKLVVDLTEVSLICSAGVGALFRNVKRFQDRKGRLLVLAANPYMQGVLDAFAGETFTAEHVVRDWRAAEDRLAGAQ